MRIAYTGQFALPGSAAASSRVSGVARALSAAGHDVTVFPMLRGAGGVQGSLGLFEIDQTFARDLPQGRFRRQFDLIWSRAGSLSHALSEQAGFDAVILYGTPSRLLAEALVADSPSRPPLVLDVVEWYAYSDRPGGVLGPASIEHALAMRWLSTRVGSYIAISTFLTDYYAKRGGRVITVPPLLEVDLAGIRPVGERESVYIAYSGSPGGKDLPGLKHLFLALMESPQDIRESIHVDIVGMSAAEAGRLLPDTHGLVDVQFWGRTNVEDARRIVAEADFTFLQRPNERYAAAGFPTKVVESLVLGTPVVCNLTSDLGRYLRDGANAVVLGCGDAPGYSSRAISEVLPRLVSSVDAFRDQRLAIAERAARDFSPTAMAGSLDSFMREVVADRR